MAKTSTPTKAPPPKGKALAPQKSGGAVAEQMPDFMAGMAGKGLENLGAGDYEVPRIALIQALSDQVDTFGIKPGNFFHTIAEQDLGPQVEIVPLFISKSFILWRPRDDGGGILARAADGVNWSPARGEFTVKLKGGKQVTWKISHPTVAGSGLADWGTMDPSDPQSQPAATQMYNIAVAMPAYPELSPAVVTLQRTSIGVARKFQGKLRISTVPIFGRRFLMRSVDDQNNMGQKYKNFAFEGVGLVEDADEFRMYQSWYEGFKASGLNVKDLESAQGEDAGGDAARGEAEPEKGGRY